MLDINFIKENKERVIKAAGAKKVNIDLETLFSLDEKRRNLLTKVEQLRQERNIISRDRDVEKGKKIKIQLEDLETELNRAESEFKSMMMEIPNVPVEGVPEGGEEDYEVIRITGEPTKFDFIPKDHLDLGEALDIIDIQRAVKVSGSRFAYLKNQGVLLELALVQFAMENLVKAGFSPVIPPALIKKEITTGLGYWHGGGNDNYYLVTDYQEQQTGEKTENALYLVGTAEHAIVPMHSGETFAQKDLPKKYAAFSPSFRREAGTYGKDTRGILRVHQFDKVEMVILTTPEQDEQERRGMLSLVEGMMQQLGLPNRVIKLASGDLGFPAAETIDIETWIPSQNKYRETHSISTTTSFQSRRLSIRYKDIGGKTQYVHILNGTAFAIGRIIIAILENYQQSDGSVKIPEVLQKYTGFSEIKKK